MPLRLMMFAVLVFTACFIDIGNGGVASDSTGGSDSTTTPATSTQPTTDHESTISSSSGLETTADPPNTTSGPDPTSTGTASGPDPTAATADNTSMTVSTGSDPSTDTMTTAAEPDPVCGNGMVEPGEDCDDGNTVEEDDCRNDCTLTACYDNVQNGDETDVDCGGDFCGPCGVCAACVYGLDCGGLLTCDRGRCTQTWIVEIKYGVHCGADNADFYTVDTAEYSGDWEITALLGGGYLQPGNPQEYGWSAHCDGFDLGDLQADFIYPSIPEALAAVDPKVTVSAYAGGPTKCGVFDDKCFDNFGSSKFSLRPLCD